MRIIWTDNRKIEKSIFFDKKSEVIFISPEKDIIIYLF